MKTIKELADDYARRTSLVLQILSVVKSDEIIIAMIKEAYVAGAKTQIESQSFPMITEDCIKQIQDNLPELFKYHEEE